MRSTQLPDLQRGFPPDISKPVQNGEPCRQGHESLRPNLRGIVFAIFPSTMINAAVSATLWQFWITFSTFILALYAQNIFGIANASPDAGSAQTEPRQPASLRNP